jgi:hypothetical protein
MKKTRIMIVIGGGLALWACGRLFWLMIDDQSWGWGLGTALYLALLAVMLVRMWKGQARAMLLSRVLAGIMFGFGCWAANFAWTFWIFKEPTLMDRILAVAHPQISVYLIGPAIWFHLSYLPIVREQFKN